VILDDQKNQEWKLCKKQCLFSQYLKDMKVEHDTLKECEEKIVKKIQYWNQSLRNIKIKKQLEINVNRKIWGIWFCNIL